MINKYCVEVCNNEEVHFSFFPFWLPNALRLVFWYTADIDYRYQFGCDWTYLSFPAIGRTRGQNFTFRNLILYSADWSFRESLSVVISLIYGRKTLRIFIFVRTPLILDIFLFLSQQHLDLCYVIEDTSRRRNNNLYLTMNENWTQMLLTSLRENRRSSYDEP